MRTLLIAVAWTVVTVIVYGLAGCSGVTATKELETSGFLCFGFCTQKTTATQIEVKRESGNAKQ